MRKAKTETDDRDSDHLMNRPIITHQLMDKMLIQFLKTLGLVAIYYCFSIGITFYQKWFIKRCHYPLIVVTSHMVVKFFLAFLIRFLYKLATGTKRVQLNLSLHVKKLSLTGVTSALDIGFSNWSFEFITISLYTMTKSTCVIFILGFAILFGLEKKRISLIVVVFLISLGLFMFTYHSNQFQLHGFLLVLSASFLSGLRWTLAQLVMQRKEMGLGNPIDMIYMVQPWMILGLIPLTVTYEIIPLLSSSAMNVEKYINNEAFLFAVKYILIGSVLAFLMELSEYLLLTFTSSLTLSIAGIVKEVFTLYLAVEYNGDEMSLINFIGLIVCLTGISVHVILKAMDVPVEKNTSSKFQTEIESKRLLEYDEEDVIFDLNPVRQ